ncbi:MAG: chaperone NapD [Thermodesulfobacteriota bacterium]
MNIAGVLVHARPEHEAEVETALAAIGGVEIHAKTDDSRFVVTVEEQGHHLSDTLIELNHIKGVLSAAMVYQHAEDEEVTEAD